MNLREASEILQAFNGPSLTHTLSGLEAALSGATGNACGQVLAAGGVTHDTLIAAGVVKTLTGQINVAIHALGLLLCLPRILERDETIEYVSLGAGNTGRQYDLETNKRIAEFKFIRWRGGAESIRQNSLFKDFTGSRKATAQKAGFFTYLVLTTLSDS